jgi:hypothetical protein
VRYILPLDSEINALLSFNKVSYYTRNPAIGVYEDLLLDKPLHVIYKVNKLAYGI